MSNKEQVDQIYRQWHQLLSQLSQFGEHWDGQVRSLMQQLEIAEKNKIPKTESEQVPKKDEKPKK